MLYMYIRIHKFAHVCTHTNMMTHTCTHIDNYIMYNINDIIVKNFLEEEFHDFQGFMKTVIF